MALYNKFHLEYDTEANGGKEDYYHGEYDDEAYGNLYIPRMEAGEANLSTVKKVFMLNKLGMVTSAIFSALSAPKNYKGKNTKQLYSAYVYVKWFTNDLAQAFRKDILIGDKKTSRVTVDKKNDTYWVVRPNTAFPSAELLEERLDIADLAEIATDVALNCLEEDEVEELAMCDLEETAKNVAMHCLEEDLVEELALYELHQIAHSVALSVF